MATQIEFNNSVVKTKPATSATYKGTLEQWVNGVSVATDQHATCLTGSLQADSGLMPIKGSYASTTICQITDMCTATELKFQQIIRDNDLRTYESKIVTITQVGTYKIRQRWNLGEGLTPTYFETLDKLDQWSSAQYIPNSRNELNL